MAAIKQGKPVLTYLLGTVMPGLKENAAKVRVKRLGLDKNLLMYFSEFEFVYAHDPHKLCKTGDQILIQNLPEKMTRLITHKVIEVVYPLGDITDPVTGKKVVISKYRDEIKAKNKMFGESSSGFDYDKAPPRGIYENIRDYSNQEAVIRYHNDPNDPQPEAL